MEISNGIEIVDLCLIIGNRLVISDMHIGFEEYLNSIGIFAPRKQIKETMQRLEKVFNQLNGKKVEQIIINGDIKHEFGRISDTEWRDTMQVIDYLLKKCNDLILIKGNHDTILGPIANKKGIEIKEGVLINDVYVCHGDAIQKNAQMKKAKRIVIGHEHPAIGLRKNSRVEKFKCFLKGKWNGKELIVMPSFNLVTEGSDVTRDKTLSPFISDINDFEAYLVDEKEGEPLYFGKIKMFAKKIDK